MIPLLRHGCPGAYRLLHNIVRVRRGNREDQLFNPFRMVYRQILGNHAPLGYAEHRGPGYAQLLHGQRLILRHLADRTALRHAVFPAEHVNGVFTKEFPIRRCKKQRFSLYCRKPVRQARKNNQVFGAVSEGHKVHVRIPNGHASVLHLLSPPQAYLRSVHKQVAASAVIDAVDHKQHQRENRRLPEGGADQFNACG